VAIAAGLSNVVAIAAGDYHNLALFENGTVYAWGGNGHGQANVPAGLINVVSIAAKGDQSLALKRDGTVVAWGCDASGQTNLAPSLNSVLAMAPGARHNVFLTGQAASTSGGQQFVLGNVPTLIEKQWLYALNTELKGELVNMAGTLHNSADQLSGAKMLLQSVLELGMPYTMERDDVLHGLFYGSEALMDLDTARDLYSAETNKLWTTPEARPLVLDELVWPRLNCFATRLSERLQDLQANGQPEIPRMIGHTLRLMNLLRDSWTQPTNSPPPVLEFWSEANTPRLVLFGEPAMKYTLQESGSLSAPKWSNVLTGLETGQLIYGAGFGSNRFYRVALPMP
jgi:hypothetical protein